MRTFALVALLALTACAGMPFADRFDTARFSERQLSALEGIPTGYGPVDRRGSEMGLMGTDEGPGLTARETVALESVLGAFGRTDKRDEVRTGTSLALVASEQTARAKARTVSALEGIPRSAFGF